MKKLSIIGMVLMLVGCSNGSEAFSGVVNELLTKCDTVDDTLSVSAAATPWGKSLTITCTTVGSKPKDRR